MRAFNWLRVVGNPLRLVAREARCLDMFRLVPGAELSGFMHQPSVDRRYIQVGSRLLLRLRASGPLEQRDIVR